jgi:2-dehydropantoate 2-reductase
VRKIAVVGIGGIGGLLGFYLTREGQDVTLICTSWHENADVMKRNGLTLKDANGEQTIRVKVLFIDELAQLKENIEIMFITVKANDTLKTVNMFKPYLTKNAWIVSLQNGINEDVIIPIVGKENTIPCVSWTGGGLLKPGYVATEGYFIIGELDGNITPRIRELAQILSLAKRTEISRNIIKERWRKLSEVSMTIPIGSIIGVRGGPAILRNEKVHSLLARVMCENLEVAAAAGYRFDTMLGVKIEDWQKLARGPAPEISRLISGSKGSFTGAISGIDSAFNEPVCLETLYKEDIILKDIAKGLPVEQYYINGYIISKGKELGVPTPVNELLLNMIKTIENGKTKPGIDNFHEMLKLTKP